MPSRTAMPRTPGVYIPELDASPPSIVGVETAVPAFIGFTEKAILNGKSVTNVPVKIGAMADYRAVFGEGYEACFEIHTGTAAGFDLELGGHPYELTQKASSRFYLYNSLRLFYDNGGGPCYIVSVGGYDTDPSSMPSELRKGLEALGDQVGPTILLSPDALRLGQSETEGDFYTFAQSMLEQAGALQDRMVILDVHGIEDPTRPIDALVAVLRNNLDKHLSYGAVYAPALVTSVVQPGEMTYANFDLASEPQLTLLRTALKAEAALLYEGDRLKEVDAMIDELSPTYDETLDNDLTAALPVLQQAYSFMAQSVGVLPPSGAMAGVYAYNDRTRGVWNAPANISLVSVLRPSVKITSEQQEDLNVPVDGKAVDAIRELAGKGTVVWGARTLDGNSNDWRYIQVRRTIIYIEQSIKNALEAFVLAPNEGKTWVAVTSMISAFLQSVWSQGGLMGATASEAFTVQCGLGSTMTPQDVLEGYMVVQVTLQMLRPAELIELVFKQHMQGA